MAQSIQDNEVTDNENSLLWKISGNDLQHDSYLLGTMHNVERTFLDSISGFRKAFKASKHIAIECDIFTQDINNRSKPKELKDYVFMPNDTSKIIRKSILWKVLKVLDKNGLNMTH